MTIKQRPPSPFSFFDSDDQNDQDDFDMIPELEPDDERFYNIDDSDFEPYSPPGSENEWVVPLRNGFVSGSRIGLIYPPMDEWVGLRNEFVSGSRIGSILPPMDEWVELRNDFGFSGSNCSTSIIHRSDIIVNSIFQFPTFYCYLDDTTIYVVFEPEKLRIFDRNPVSFGRGSKSDRKTNRRENWLTI